MGEERGDARSESSHLRQPIALSGCADAAVRRAGKKHSSGGAAVNIRQHWDRYWFAPERPLNLGICRMLFFALMILLYGSASLGSLAQVNESSAFWSPNWLFGAVDRIVHDRAHF